MRGLVGRLDDAGSGRVGIVAGPFIIGRISRRRLIWRLRTLLISAASTSFRRRMVLDSQRVGIAAHSIQTHFFVVFVKTWGNKGEMFVKNVANYLEIDFLKLPSTSEPLHSYPAESAGDLSRAISSSRLLGLQLVVFQ